jgi:hypothetical protein
LYLNIGSILSLDAGSLQKPLHGPQAGLAQDRRRMRPMKDGSSTSECNPQAGAPSLAHFSPQRFEERLDLWPPDIRPGRRLEHTLESPSLPLPMLHDVRI